MDSMKSPRIAMSSHVVNC